MQAKLLATRYLCTYRADLEPRQHLVGDAPFGRRQIALIRGGTVDGERLRGNVLPGGGDWALVDDRAVLRLDVRATFETHDGAVIYVTYHGILRPYSRDLRARLEAGELDDDFYFRIAPSFETADDRYRWLNGIVSIGVGSLTDTGVEYDIYEVL